MYKFFAVAIFSALPVTLLAQSAAPVKFADSKGASLTVASPWGKIFVTDLEMKTCDFEPDASAEVLFDKETITPDDGGRIERHTRIKIFNERGKSYGNARLEYYSGIAASGIVVSEMEAQTINLVDGKCIITPLDKKSIYTEKVDRTHTALVFAFPNVQVGSVIEYRYKLAFAGYPTWYFQNRIPTRYSEIHTEFPPSNLYGRQVREQQYVKQPYIKTEGSVDDPIRTRAMNNVISLPDEVFMRNREDNLQRIKYYLDIVMLSTWSKIVNIILKTDFFGDQLNRNLDDEAAIIAKAKTFTTDAEKINYVFNEVKNRMKWNEIHSFGTVDGTVRAWTKKTGNSTEINLCVYDLLKKSGVKPYLMFTSAEGFSRLNPTIPDIYTLGNTIVYIPIDSTKCYALDATNKYNLFNMIPVDALNTYGIQIDEDSKQGTPFFMSYDDPVVQYVSLNAEVKPGGKLVGSAELSSSAYNRIDITQKYKTDGDEKYTKYLTGGENNVKISNLKFENLDVDSLALKQNFDFAIDMTGADEAYMYLNTNLFTLMGPNPFLSEHRFSDVDFKYKQNYSISGVYKLPDGYKIEAQPKSYVLNMPDQSIVFKRNLVVDGSTVLVRYTLTHKKTLYGKQEYLDLREFYKQMYTLLAEQIVLKKI